GHHAGGGDWRTALEARPSEPLCRCRRDRRHRHDRLRRYSEGRIRELRPLSKKSFLTLFKRTFRLLSDRTIHVLPNTSQTFSLTGTKRAMARRRSGGLPTKDGAIARASGARRQAANRVRTPASSQSPFQGPGARLRTALAPSMAQVTCTMPQGNVTNDGVHSYTYDSENRLASVDGGATASYAYDHQNHRIKKVVGSSIT